MVFAHCNDIAIIAIISLSYRPRALLESQGIPRAVGIRGTMANWNRHILGLALVKAGALELLQHLADPMAEVGMTVSPSGVLVEVDTGP